MFYVIKNYLIFRKSKTRKYQMLHIPGLYGGKFFNMRLVRKLPISPLKFTMKIWLFHVFSFLFISFLSIIHANKLRIREFPIHHFWWMLGVSYTRITIPLILSHSLCSSLFCSLLEKDSLSSLIFCNFSVVMNSIFHRNE